MLSLLDKVYALDPLLGAQVRTELERLRDTIEDLELILSRKNLKRYRP